MAESVSVEAEAFPVVVTGTILVAGELAVAGKAEVALAAQVVASAVVPVDNMVSNKHSLLLNMLNSKL